MLRKTRKKTLKSKASTKTRTVSKKRVLSVKQTKKALLVVVQKTYAIRTNVCKTYHTITARILIDRDKKTAKLLGICGLPTPNKLPVISGTTGDISGCTEASLTHYTAINNCMQSILRRVYLEFK